MKFSGVKSHETNWGISQVNVFGEACSAVIFRIARGYSVRQVTCHTPPSLLPWIRAVRGPLKHLTCEVGLGELISWAILILLYLICCLF